MKKAASIIILIYAIILTIYIINDKLVSNPINDLEMNARSYFVCAFGPNWELLNNESLIFHWNLYNPQIHINPTDNFKKTVKEVYFSQAYKCDPDKVLEKAFNFNVPKNFKDSKTAS